MQTLPNRILTIWPLTDIAETGADHISGFFLGRFLNYSLIQEVAQIYRSNISGGSP